MSLQIRLILPTDEVKEVGLPAEVACRRLVPALVSKLGLPTVAADGRALQYELVVAGEALGPGTTLIEADVAIGAAVHLRAQSLTWSAGSPEPEEGWIVSREPAVAPRRAGPGPSQPSPGRSGPPAPRRNERDMGTWLRKNWWVLLVAFYFFGNLFDDILDARPEPQIIEVTRLVPFQPTPAATAAARSESALASRQLTAIQLPEPLPNGFIRTLHVSLVGNLSGLSDVLLA